MKFFYDLHIHSDLSPCGESEMTPNNIVNMAAIKQLDIISVTDHNTIKNYPAVKELASSMDILAIPGMEVTTKEGVHLLVYFNDYESAEIVSEKLYANLPNIMNNKIIFGNQNIYDANDKVIGEIDKLLINSTNFSINEILEMIHENNGIAIPAHADKISDGIIGVLGFIPLDYEFKFIEIYNKTYKNNMLNNYIKIFNSDAHKLEDISEPINFFDCEDIESVLKYIGLKTG